MTSRIVIAGGSLAGVRAAEGARDGGFEGDIVMVEPAGTLPVIDRPQLSKSFLLETSPAKPLSMRPGVAEGLSWRRNRASQLDLATQTIELEDGERLRFDGLIVATGAQPRLIPELERFSNVTYLRDDADATELRGALGRARSIAIIGGGVLGCELAATCRTLNKQVAVVDSIDGLMLRSVGPAGSEVLRELHARKGVSLHLGNPVAHYHGQGRVTALELMDGTHIHADLVIVAVGAVPCTGWLSGAGLTLDDGLVCNDTLVAAGTDVVLGAGDVVRFGGTRAAGGIRVEHWTNASQQGQRAGRNLAALLRGESATPFHEVPYFWSDQFEWKIKMFGQWSETWVRQPESTNDAFVVTYHDQDGCPVGVMAVNASSSLLRWRAAITAAHTQA